MFLLVASAGGHVYQLMHLRERLGVVSNALWVTYGVKQTSSLLADHRVAYAHHPTTKHIPNALRNYRLARQVFTENEIEAVVSTGAAVAVPFILRARQLDIPCHYIESATRIDGPSLSGRILQHLTRANLYRQMGSWGQPRWRQGPCVFDGFTVETGVSRPLRRVVISLGTHAFSFSALVERVATHLHGIDAEVLWQLGETPDPGDLPGRVVEELPSDELERAIADADVVIGHAGVGLALAALRAGTVPVLVPRRRVRREHTDDHQAQLARKLSARRLAIAAEVEDLTTEHVERASHLSVIYEEPGPFELTD